MARFVLKQKFIVFSENKGLTEMITHFKSPLMLYARRCSAFERNQLNVKASE